jgi:predicted TIM-barrel fold metal-dependent hydrolase
MNLEVTKTAGSTLQGAPRRIAIRPEWLASRTEEIVEPDLPLVDAHHHLWDPPGARYLFDEFLDDVTCGHHVEASVFVECHSMYRFSGPDLMKPVGETEFIAGVAAQSESGRYGMSRLCKAIVGFLDYSLGDRVGPVLDAHIQAAGGRFRGVRGRAASHKDPEINLWQTPDGILGTEAARQAVAAVGKRGLSLDIWAYQTQIADVLRLCREFPDMAIVIDHVGGPIGCGPYKAHRTELFEEWSKGITALGALPNTFLKVSGMAMRYFGLDAHLDPMPPSSDDLVRAWQRHFDVCMDAFGPARSMFASNFPVDKASCSYGVLWNAFKKLSQSCSPSERAAMLSGTAKKVYRIADSAKEE